MLRPSEAEFDALPAPQAQALRRAIGLDEGTGVDRLSVAVAVRGVLDRLSTGRPVLVIVDDVQWLDEPSRSALLFVARRLERMSVAIILACRSGELTEEEARGLQLLPLEPLRRREAQAVLRAATDVSIDARVRRALLDVAEGNPLALTELPLALSADQLAGFEPLGEPVPVNGGLERAFGTRIARLPEDARFALLVIAAAGPDSAEPARKALAEAGLALDALEPAEADGLVAVSPGIVTFRHPIVRSVVYHGESAGRRRTVHAWLAAAETEPDRRAWHRYSAVEGADEAVADELVAVAQRALARGAPGSAARAFEAAGERSSRASVRGRRLADAARAAHRAGDVKVAARVAREARNLTSEPITLADLLLVEADLAMRSGDLEGAHRELTSQADRLIEIDRRRAATMLLLAAKLRIYQLEAAAAADEVDRALALLPEGEHELVHLVAMSMSQTAAGRKGARDAALAAAAAAAEAPHGHAHTLGIAWPLIWLEEYDVAREVTARALAIQREAGFLLYLPQTLLPLAELEFRTGHWETAMAAAKEALDLLRRDAPADRGSFGGGGPGPYGGGERERRRVSCARPGRARARRRVRLAELVRAGARGSRLPRPRHSATGGRRRAARDGGANRQTRRGRGAVALGVDAGSRRGARSRGPGRHAPPRCCRMLRGTKRCPRARVGLGCRRPVPRDPRRHGCIRSSTRVARSRAHAVRTRADGALLRREPSPLEATVGGERSAPQRPRDVRRARCEAVGRARARPSYGRAANVPDDARHRSTRSLRRSASSHSSL